MNNLIKFPSQRPQSAITATPNGLHIDGLMMSYIEAIEKLDRGDYDGIPQAGRDLIWQVREGVKKRYFKPTDSHTLTLYRWVVADMFYTEQENENGTHELDNGDVGAIYVGEYGGVVIYRITDRLAMANNIEGALIEKYGADQGTRNAITFYYRMIDVGTSSLSGMGREILIDLHNGFIQDLNANGLPNAPTAH